MIVRSDGPSARHARLTRALLAALAVLVALLVAQSAWREYRVWTLLVQVQGDLGMARLERALGRLVEAEALTPLDAAVQAEVGRVQTMRARWRSDAGAEPAAIAAYERAIALSPRDALHRAEFGWALIRLGRPDEAERLFRDALALDPHNVYYLGSLGRSLEAQGRPEAALEAYRRAQSILPTREIRDRIRELEAN